MKNPPVWSAPSNPGDPYGLSPLISRDASKPVAEAAHKDVGIPVVARDDPVPGGTYVPVLAEPEAARHRGDFGYEGVGVSSLFMSAAPLIDGEIAAEAGA